MRKIRNDIDMRRELDKDPNSLISLISKWRESPKLLTENEKELLYFGVSKWVLNCANKHYKSKQKTGQYSCLGVRNWYEPIIDNIPEYTKHTLRMDAAFSFLSRTDGTTELLMFSFNRRFQWLELLIELKLKGVSLFSAEVPIEKQLNSVLVRKIILINVLVKSYKHTHSDKEPSDRDLIKEFIKYRIRSGFKIRLSDIKGFLGVYVRYTTALREANPPKLYIRTKHTKDYISW